MDKKDLKTPPNFENITKTLDEVKEKLFGQGTEMMKHLEKFKTMNTPKSTKNLIINGKNCIVSLTTDARVILTLHSTDDSEKIYNEIQSIDMNVIADLKAKYEKEKEKTWWHKLLGK